MSKEFNMELLDLKNAAAVAEYEAFLQSHPKGHFAHQDIVLVDKI